MIDVKFGWKRDLPDFRDFRYSAHPEMAAPVIDLPPRVDLRASCPAIKDQGDMGSCVSNGVAFAVEYLQMLALKEQKQAPEVFGPDFSDVSRLFIYYNAREFEGTVDEDEGTQIRTGVKVIRSQGICQETVWPYLKDSLFLKPTPPSYDEASQHVIPTYYRVNHTKMDAMRNCLALGFPIVFGASLYSSFMEVAAVRSDGKIPLPDSKEEFKGGHCMTIVGYDNSDNRFIVANSWGTNVGDQGYLYIPYDYLTNYNLASDFWTIRQEA